jgi:FkbM family methyltransferase
MTKEEVIQLWKENDVDHIDFVFSCGGDSMNETEIVIYDSKDKIIKNKDIEDYFDEQVYNAVTFYDNSDGVYMGEDGTVTITLEEVDDDEVDFIYSKSSTEEWNETESFSKKIYLTNNNLESKVTGNIDNNNIEVFTSTLNHILKKNKIYKINLFSLDVEGYEAEVLKGLNLNFFDIDYILIETNDFDKINFMLKNCNYRFEE